MSTPKEKAVELAYNFASLTNDSFITNHAKQSALIAVDEILKDGKEWWGNTTPEPYEHTTHYDYWQQVKTEIENL